MPSLVAVLGTCKYQVWTSKRNVPLCETTVRTEHSSVINYHWKNWHCLTYLMTCHRAGISLSDISYDLSQGRYLTVWHILWLVTGQVSHCLGMSYDLSQGRYLTVWHILLLVTGQVSHCLTYLMTRHRAGISLPDISYYSSQDRYLIHTEYSE